jgi:LIM domain-binding protein 1
MPLLQPDYKIFEMNKRLQQRTDDSDNLWWDAFANEFFEDEAQLTLTFCLEDGPKRYTVGRTLIPRFFRSIFEGGVTELHWELRHAKESFHQATVSLDCDQATMVTQHGKPMFTKVYTEGRLIVEFNFDDLLRIRSWHFAIRNHRELIPRSVIAMQEPGMVETLSKNITRQGLTATTLNYLRVSTTNVPGRLEDLPPEEANEPQPSAGVLPAVSTVVGSGTPGPLPSTGGPQLDGLDFGSESFQFQ